MDTEEFESLRMEMDTDIDEFLPEDEEGCDNFKCGSCEIEKWCCMRSGVMGEACDN